jgi:hypothetical protein
MRILAGVILLLTSSLPLAQPEPPPIIDMHLHAHTLRMYGTPPPTVCTNDQEIVFPGLDPREPFTPERVKSCRSPLPAPASDEELLRTMLEVLKRHDIRAVATGPLEEVNRWHAAAPDRIIPGVPFDDYEKRSPDDFRRLFTAGKFTVFAEISAQYHGLSAADESLEPFSPWPKSWTSLSVFTWEKARRERPIADFPGTEPD